MSDGTTRRQRRHEAAVSQTERLFVKLDQLMADQEAVLARIRQLVVIAARKEGTPYGNK